MKHMKKKWKLKQAKLQQDILIGLSTEEFDYPTRGRYPVSKAMPLTLVFACSIALSDRREHSKVWSAESERAINSRSYFTVWTRHLNEDGTISLQTDRGTWMTAVNGTIRTTESYESRVTFHFEKRHEPSSGLFQTLIRFINNARRANQSINNWTRSILFFSLQIIAQVLTDPFPENECEKNKKSL